MTRFYLVRKKQENSAKLWVSRSCVAAAYDMAQPAGAEWAAVYAKDEEHALARAMARKSRIKWRPYA